MRPPRCRFPSRHARESASKAFGHPKLIERLFLARSICGPSSWHALRWGYAWLRACQRRQLVLFWLELPMEFDKDTAVRRAQLALDDYIKQYKAENHLGAVTVSAMRAA